jgi:L-fuculose-phosphate aldolase
MANINEMISTGKDLFLRGVVDGGGNFSVREGDRIYITKKGAMLGSLKESDIIEVAMEGDGDSDLFAHPDLAVHRAIYKETPFKAVIHATPAAATSLASITENKIITADMAGQSLLRSIPVVRARTQSGRDKIAQEELTKLLPSIYKSGYVVCVVKELGSYAVGATLLEALQITLVTENSCKIVSNNKFLTPPPVERPRPQEHHDRRRSAIPPSIGVMDRQPPYKRGMGR